MNRFILATVFTVVVCPVQGQDAAIRLTRFLNGDQQAPPVRTNCGCWSGEPCTCGSTCSCPPASYNKAAACAAHHSKPLVTFVNMKVRPITGCVVCEAPWCFNDARARIIVSMPVGNELHWLMDLTPRASDGEIRAATTRTDRTDRTESTIKQYLTVQPTYGPQPFQTYFREPPMFMQPMRMSFGGGGGRGGSSC